MSTSAQEGQAPQGNGNTTGGQGQEPPNGTGQDQASGQQGQQGNQQQEGQAPDFSNVQDPALRAHLERQEHELKEARQEAARYRTERSGLQEQVQQYQRANETAEQKAERERQERDQEAERLRQENRDLRVGGQVRDKATSMRAHNPGLVWNMVKDRIQTDAEGKPTNMDEVLSELKQSDPYLFKRASTDAGGGNEGGEGGQTINMNDAIRRASGRT